MKHIFLSLIVLINIAGCATEESKLSTDSTVLENTNENTGLASEQKIVDTLITPKETDELYEKLKGLNLSKKELTYLNRALNKAKRFDALNTIARESFLSKIKKDSAAIADFRQTTDTLKYNKNDTSRKAEIYAYKAMQLKYALAHLKKFRKTDISTQAIRARMRNDGFYSIYFSEEDLSQLLAAYQQEEEEKRIDGLRVYLAKYDNTVGDNENDEVKNARYTLILVGTRDGKDVYDRDENALQQTIRNYGNPCRPPCFRNTERIDLLGERAGED